MSSRGRKAVSKTYARSASTKSSVAVLPADSKKELPKSTYTALSTKIPSYRSSTLNKADQLFDEVISQKSSTKIEENTEKVLQVQNKKTTNVLFASQERSPTRSTATRRSSPRSAEKRPLDPSTIEKSSLNATVVDPDSLLHSTTQQSLSGRMDEIQLESPSKKLHRQLWRAGSPEEKLADDSLFVNTSENEERSEPTGNLSQNTFMLESEAEDDDFEQDQFQTSPKKPQIDKASNSNLAGKKRPIYHNQPASQPEDVMDDFETLPVSSSQPNMTTTVSSASQSINFTNKTKRVTMTSQKFYDDDGTVSQIKCRKEEKQLYTVVKTVKQAHQCLESGEMQQIRDDIDYYLESLTEATDMALKRLSLCSLAQKCVQTSFRAHLRAYGYAKSLFHRLLQCHEDQILALNCACIFYLLSRDRSPFPLDAEILNLALKLMNLDEKQVVTSDDGDYGKFKGRVWDILKEWYGNVRAVASQSQQEVAFDVTLENLSSSFLVTESLVFIFIRNRNELLRLAMCKFGGLDILVQKLKSHVPGDSEVSLSELKLVERFFHILTQVTEMCPRNQAYLIAYDNSLVVGVILEYFNHILSVLPKLADLAKAVPGLEKATLALLTVCLKVLCNLTHLSEVGCRKFGSSTDFLVNCVRLLTSYLPKYVALESQFDFSTLILGLLINLIEPCNANRRILLSAQQTIADQDGGSVTKSPVQLLMEKFLHHEKIASAISEDVDRKIDFCCSQPEISSGREVEFAKQFKETLESAESQAGQHMEDSMICAHIALFFGLLLQQNEDAIDEIRRLSRPDVLNAMITNITRFMDFLRHINNLNATTERTMHTAIELLERLDRSSGHQS